MQASISFWLTSRAHVDACDEWACANCNRVRSGGFVFNFHWQAKTEPTDKGTAQAQAPPLAPAAAAPCRSTYVCDGRPIELGPQRFS